MQKNGTHLWTIPVEIYYYFAIPILCIIMHIIHEKTSWRIRGFVLCALVFISYFGSYNNVFMITDSQMSGKYNNVLTGIKLSFFVFFSGSVLGFVYFSFEKSNLRNHAIFKSLLFQHALNVISIAWAIYAYKSSGSHFTWLSKSGFLWAIFLFLILISSSEVNLIKIYLEESNILRSFGKYSFGIYLLHPLVIYLFKLDKTLLKYSSDLKACYLYGLIILVSYVLGFFWYHFLEKYCIKIANKLCQKLTRQENIFQTI